jgi:ABC-type lipoprotein release transport system permease subunit
MIAAVGAGWLVLKWTGSLTAVFLTLGLALALFGTLIAVAVARGVWFSGESARQQP